MNIRYGENSETNWKKLLLFDETKIQTRRHVWRKPDAARHHKHAIPHVKHGDGSLMALEGL